MYLILLIIYSIYLNTKLLIFNLLVMILGKEFKLVNN